MENKYNYFTYFDKKKNCMAIKATASYRGNTVNGYAYVHPDDTFNEEFGRNLARKRCEKKIYMKKRKHFSEELKYASNGVLWCLEEAERFKKRAASYAEIISQLDAQIATVDGDINQIVQDTM